MSDRLQNLLSEKACVLADGATGTNFFALGLQHGDAPELWNLDHPEKVMIHYRSFIDAGSDLILTNSFGGTRNRLKLHKAENLCRDINQRAAELAHQACAAAGRPEVIVAGSMGPTGDLFEPLGPLTIEAGMEAFAEQAQGLAAGGADLLWIETLSSIDEVKAAVSGAATTGLPLVVTLSFDTNGRTMMGVTPAQMAELTHQLHPNPVAFGGNCGTGAAELVAALLNMSESAQEGDVMVAKSNCGIPEFVDGEVVYNGTPELMADYVRLAVDCGARIIGGCCGTTPDHIRAMRVAMDDHVKGDKPSMETIGKRLGSISDGANQQQAGGLGALPKGRKRGSRRRGRGEDRPSADF
ncbi:MAG: betaine--homocysteine S-methyltransferase [Pseudomonadota bacterium]